MNYHPTAEKLVDLLVARTTTKDRHAFRVLTTYYMGMLASLMRTELDTKDRGSIPINCYSLCLLPSGAGKNYAVNTLEEVILDPFKDTFISEVLMNQARMTISQIAVDESRRTGEDPDELRDELEVEFFSLGEFVFTYDSATSAAVRQLRRKLLMSGAGAMSLLIDEIGSNLSGSSEVLTDYLSLYDKGLLKQKIIKNTKEAKRGIELDGPTPANLLMMGTPSKVLDGANTESEFFELLETGYARRLMFAYSKDVNKTTNLTAEQMFDQACATNTCESIAELEDLFGGLAAGSNFNRKIKVSRELSVCLIEYKMQCEERAAALKEHQNVLRAELSHRYFKALKVAGTYAFIDGTTSLTPTQVDYAIQLVEDSGTAFEGLINRERTYVKLARYLADAGVEVTRADLVEDLPFFTGSESFKREQIDLSVAYGYMNNIIIRREVRDGIEFLHGEVLEETQLEKLIVSYSDDSAYRYLNEEIPYQGLDQLLTHPNLHFVNHHLKDNHRMESNCFRGFNMIVLDVDTETSIESAMMLLKEYEFMLYTTKRHTEEENRFRIVFPLSHVVKLTTEDFKVFMSNIYDWLPIKVDTQTSQRSKKWLTNDGQILRNEGSLLDATLFIPKTRKSDEMLLGISTNSNLSSLERWFWKEAQDGNRNNTIARYAFALMDAGHDEAAITKAVTEFNKKLKAPLPKDEIQATVLKTIGRRIGEKA